MTQISEDLTVPKPPEGYAVPPEPEYFPVPPVEDKPKKPSSWPIFGLIGLALLSAGFLLWFLLTPSSKGGSKLQDFTKPIGPQALSQQWIDCDDVREVIEEGSKVYAACLGGVLVVDKETGEVVDQISVTDGLGSSTVVSLIKNDNKLYIGTQDGFTIFDLKTRKAKKISVAQGLVSGANVKLALEGSNLWVATFNGVSKYDLNSEEITNYTNLLVDNADTYSVSSILVSPNFIYFTLPASDGTSGGVAKFDKQTRTWERFGVDDFYPDKSKSRVDFFEAYYDQDYVYVSNYTDRGIWSIPDKAGASWERLGKVEQELSLSTSRSVSTMLNGSHRIGIFVEENLFEYTPGSGEVKKVYPKESQEDFIQKRNITNPSSLDNIWLGKNYGLAKAKSVWLSKLNPNTNVIEDVVLQNRPTSFDSLIGADKDQIFLSSSEGILKYGLKSKKFSKLGNETASLWGKLQSISLGTNHFYPLTGTNLVMVYGQECGQGCSLPELYLYNYSSGSEKKYPIPDTLLRDLNPIEFKNFKIYSSLHFYNYDENKKELIFTGEVQDSEGLVFNLESETWRKGERQSLGTAKNRVAVCNSLFAMDESGNFMDPACKEKYFEESSIENPVYKFSLYNPGDRYGKDQLMITYKATGESKVLTPKVGPKDYSPLDAENSKNPDYNPDPIKIRSFTFAQGRLWVGTERGLSIYDISKDSWTVVGAKEGLLSSAVRNLVVTIDSVWVKCEWGGLSQIPLKNIIN